MQKSIWNFSVLYVCFIAVSAKRISRFSDGVPLVENWYLWGRTDVFKQGLTVTIAMMYLINFWKGTKTYAWVGIIVLELYTSTKCISIRRVYSVPDDMGFRDQVRMIAKAMVIAPLETSMLHLHLSK